MMTEKKSSFMQMIEKHKKIIVWVTAILVLLTALITTFDKITTFFASPPTQEYRLILLDSSSGMTAEFDSGKSKWESAKEAVSKAFYGHDKRIQELALRQFGGSCSSPVGELKLKFGQKKKVSSLIDETQMLAGEATLIQALWNAIGDFAEQERLSSDQQLFNTITVITGSTEACNPQDTTRIKNRLQKLDIELDFQIIPMGMEKRELEAITNFAKSLGGTSKIFPANNQEQLERWIQNPEIADAFTKGEGYWRSMEDEKAIPLLEQAAKKGVSEAMLILGDIHADITKETHTETDDKKAIDWYKKSAKAGKVAAMTRLGIMYRDGRGVGDDASKNYNQARNWFTRAADLGDVEAKDNLDKLLSAK